MNVHLVDLETEKGSNFCRGSNWMLLPTCVVVALLLHTNEKIEEKIHFPATYC